MRALALTRGQVARSVATKAPNMKWRTAMMQNVGRQLPMTSQQWAVLPCDIQLWSYLAPQQQKNSTAFSCILKQTLFHDSLPIPQDTQ